MPQNYVEASIQADIDSGELFAMLQDSEALGCWEEKGIIHIYWSEDKWTSEILQNLKKALALLGAADHLSPEIRLVPDTDWNSAWAASLIPIRIGNRIRIRQSWHAADPDFDGIELILDPKRAFGTGHHATTQLVIEWLEQHIRGEEMLLDIGTGTGILAMAALRLGAKSALAIDNDPVAIECAGEYAAVNGIGKELELRTGSFEDLDAGGFNMILANLNGKVMPELCEMLPKLLEPNGIACLSGLQQQDYDEVAAALSNANMQINARMDREEWLALEVSQELKEQEAL